VAGGRAAASIKAWPDASACLWRSAVQAGFAVAQHVIAARLSSKRRVLSDEASAVGSRAPAPPRPCRRPARRLAQPVARCLCFCDGNGVSSQERRSKPLRVHDV